MIKYTIVIPHYNLPDKLRRLLLSIPKRNNIQIIVVDDCSSCLNEYKKVIDEFGYVEFYSTETNGGGGKARNVGLAHATGDYIIFADSDDYFLPEFEIFIDRNDRNKNIPDIVFCNAVAKYEDTNKLSKRTEHLNKFFKILSHDPDKALDLFKYNFGEPWCKIIKRSIIVDNCIKFDETPIHNDTKFSYLVGFYAKDIEYYPEPIYTVIDRCTSVSKAVNWAHLSIRAAVFADKEIFLNKKGIKFVDPITFNPLLIALLNLRVGKFRCLMHIYKKHGISLLSCVIGCISSIKYYLFHKTETVFKYTRLNG